MVKKIPLCISGIDKVNAASATTTMINYFKIDVIFNLGLCGTSKITIKITRPIVVKSIEYFDVDLTGFEYKKNQIPDEKIKICIKRKYIRKIFNLLVENGEKPVIGPIASGDTIVTKKILIFFLK